MGELADRIAASLAQGDVPAIQFGGRWASWADLNAIVTALDSALDALGQGRGASIACALRNRPPHCATMMGLVGGGRCLVTLNALTPDDALADEIVRANAAVLVASADDWARPALRSAAAAIGAAGLCLTGDVGDPVVRVTGLERVGDGPHQPPLPDIAIMMLTSGTTGPPKRVPLRAATLERQLVEAAGARSPRDAGAPAVAAGIMHGSIVHIGGVWGVLGPAMAGRPFVLLEKFNVADWHAAIVAQRPAAVGAPPAALRMILDADIAREDLASLTSIGAGTAPLDPAIVDEFLRRYDLPILSNYGATEFAGGVASWSYRAFRELWARKRGAVGRIHRGIDARVVDADSGAPLPFGDEGILELKGFAAGDGESWVRTTDRAILDADHFLWIRGRADDAIIRGGFKVHPAEVAAALETHPAVREASVVGIADRRLGEVPAAALILRSNAPIPGDAELADHVRSRLNAYCVPTRFRVVGELPRTPSMKVSLPGVRALFG